MHEGTLEGELGCAPFGTRASVPLPTEVHAEVLVEPAFVRLEELFQAPPGRRGHLLLVAAFVDIKGFVISENWQAAPPSCDLSVPQPVP